MSKLHAAKNEMQIGGLAHCWWDSSKQDSPSCDVKTLRWNPPKQEQLSEGMPAPGKIKALKMGLPIDRSLCIGILLSSLMPFQCQQTASYKTRRGWDPSDAPSLEQQVLGLLEATTQPRGWIWLTFLCLTTGSGRWILANLAGVVGDVIAPPLPLLSVLPPALHSLVELAARSCAGITSTRGKAQQLCWDRWGREAFYQTLQGCLWFPVP